MLVSVMLILLSLALLLAGAEILVSGGAMIARRLGLSGLVVGLTVVAFGTSAPELVVSVGAALADQGDVCIGNVVGSNIFNIGVILGLTALICPIPVHAQVLRVDGPIALAAALLVPLLLMDGFLTRLEGLLLLALLIAYSVYNLIASRGEAATPDENESVRQRRHWSLDLFLVLGGLVLLISGSRLLIDNASVLARSLGVSEVVISLTIVAAGTSMPELSTSLIAAIRRQSDIAIGNVVGSNVFNILGILGVGSLVAPLQVVAISTLDVAMMIGVTLLLLPLLYTGRLLHRLEGGALLLVYGVYLVLRWP